MISGTISALNIVPVVHALERLGYHSASILARAGTSIDELSAPHARVPAGLEFAFWDAIADVTHDALIGLRVAEQIPIGALGGYEYLIRNSPTVRAGIEQANRFERVMDDHSRISVIEHDDDTASVRLWRSGGLPHPPRGTECLFGVIARAVPEILPGARAKEVRFAHPAPVSPRAFAQRLGFPVGFEREHNEIVFPTELLDRPLGGADPVLSQVLEEHMTHVLAQTPDGDPFLHRVRSVLGEALPHGEVSLEQLARALHLSARTLRRRLDERGTSYRTLLDELRKERGCYFVARTDVPFEQISQALGFADPSAFYRAFKRWTGTTPAAHRAAQ